MVSGLLLGLPEGVEHGVELLLLGVPEGVVHSVGLLLGVPE